jgi:hypothetical protein
MEKESRMNIGNKEVDLLIADLIIRVNAIEHILISKNVCTADDLLKQVKKISESVVKFLQQKQENENKN